MNTQLNIVGLRHHVAPQLLTQWFENEPNSEFSLYEQPLCLMRAHQCSQDEHAVMAIGLGQGVVGYVSRVDARRCADALRQSAVPHLSARVVGCDKVRRSLLVEVLDALPEPNPETAVPADWHYDDDGPVMRLPECFVKAEHYTLMMECILDGRIRIKDEAELEDIVERFEADTVADLSGDAYVRRRRIAEALAVADDARMRPFASRIWALMDHMGSDELMERWTRKVLPRILEGEEMQYISLRYLELTFDELAERVRNIPHGLGRDWLAGDRIEFVRRMYYQQISRRQMMHLLTLVGLYELRKDGAWVWEKFASRPEALIGIPSLNTAEAETLFAALQEGGMLDKKLQPVGMSLAEKGLLVSVIADRLRLDFPWRDFGELWDMKPETLRKGYYRSQDQKKTLAFHDRLKKVLETDE